MLFLFVKKKVKDIMCNIKMMGKNEIELFKLHGF
jgi:hypothetical protein